MPDEKKLLFEASLYDTSDKYKDNEEWQRNKSAFVLADDLETATKIAKKNAGETEVVVGIREMVDARIYL